MFTSAILDVTIGVLFAFLAVSLAASSINEAIASLLNSRGTSLMQGIQRLLNDAGPDGLVLQIYNHALTHPQGDGAAATLDAVSKPLPAYMASTDFAAALVHGLITLHAEPTAPGAPLPIEQAIANIPDRQLQKTLAQLYARADGEITRFEGAVATWFDGAMDRVSGAYKRSSQAWMFVFALVIAMVLNVDCLHLAKMLWQQPSLAAGISATQGMTGPQALKVMATAGFPIGWSDWPVAQYWSTSVGPLGWVSAIAGWLITAFATLFGAPFWFDLLQRFVRLRGTGPSPAEKAC